ncbi:MAG: diguanylate cyclase [Meiothermus sp.]|nr:diguanylate cyclase [Meiothermus sp.]
MPHLNQTRPASGHVILVVDDDEATLSTLEELLTQEGHTVRTARSGREAMERLREQAVHLMLLNSLMPGQSGEETVRAVREFNPEVQVVLQTGCASERPARQTLAELDIHGYHDRSEGPERLLVWVDAALKSYRQGRALRASSRGMEHILEAAPELHRLQPLEDLLYGILLQIEGLMGLSGTVIALREGGLVVVEPDQKFRLRVGTGRFQGKGWEQLSQEEQQLILEAANTGQIQWENLMALPLRAGERAVGVVLMEQSASAPTNLKILQLFASQAAVAIENVRLYELATVDDLTRVSTRRHWLSRLDDALQLALRHAHPLSLVLLDLDHFKAVNDRHGHLAGDRVLAALGRTLLPSLRRSDAVGRIGGEEFAVLLPHTDLEGAALVAEKLRQAVAQMTVEWEGEALRLTASLGVATLRILPTQTARDSGSLERTRTALLQAADEALYRAKAEGRDRVAEADVLEGVPAPALEVA